MTRPRPPPASARRRALGEQLPHEALASSAHGGSGNGSGRSSTWSASVNAAVVAPTPRAMTTTAVR